MKLFLIISLFNSNMSKMLFQHAIITNANEIYVTYICILRPLGYLLCSGATTCGWELLYWAVVTQKLLYLYKYICFQERHYSCQWVSSELHLTPAPWLPAQWHSQGTAEQTQYRIRPGMSVKLWTSTCNGRIRRQVGTWCFLSLARDALLTVTTQTAMQEKGVYSHVQNKISKLRDNPWPPK